jgi:hypothetical protein
MSLGPTRKFSLLVRFLVPLRCVSHSLVVSLSILISLSFLSPILIDFFFLMSTLSNDPSHVSISPMPTLITI